MRERQWLHLFIALLLLAAAGALPSNRTALLLAQRINDEGPFLGLLLPTPFEMQAIIDQSVFTPHQFIPWLDLAGRRFHIGSIHGHKIILVQSASAMLNAGITTQQLLDFFDVTGVLHCGIAGSANDSLSIGDVTIPKYWAHTALWNWQKFSNRSSGFLSSGPNGDFTSDIGQLRFSDYSASNNGIRAENYLSSVWVQPENILTPSGTPEVYRNKFWMRVDKRLYKVARKLEGMDLVSCFNATTCLKMKPKVVVGLRGASSNIFVDNAAYREFMRETFSVSSLDMESAAVAMVCVSNEVPFIVIRSISDSAGNSEGVNEVAGFKFLASSNAAKVVSEFLKLLPKALGPNDM